MVQPAKLNPDMIVREAIALLQEGGLEALSLRKLAARLNVSAPSLARHVGDKGKLTALVSATIFAEALELIPKGLKGDAWLLAFGHALRTKQAATRDITALVASVPPDPQIDVHATGQLQEELRNAGLTDEISQAEQSAIQAYVTGWMVFETSPRRELFQQRLPHDNVFEDGLAALIAGFASRR